MEHVNPGLGIEGFFKNVHPLPSSGIAVSRRLYAIPVVPPALPRAKLPRRPEEQPSERGAPRYQTSLVLLSGVTA
jgi:hypothetical protein